MKRNRKDHDLARVVATLIREEDGIRNLQEARRIRELTEYHRRQRANLRNHHQEDIAVERLHKSAPIIAANRKRRRAQRFLLAAMQDRERRLSDRVAVYDQEDYSHERRARLRLLATIKTVVTRMLIRDTAKPCGALKLYAQDQEDVVELVHQEDGSHERYTGEATSLHLLHDPEFYQDCIAEYEARLATARHEGLYPYAPLLIRERAGRTSKRIPTSQDHHQKLLQAGYTAATDQDGNPITRQATATAIRRAVQATLRLRLGPGYSSYDQVPPPEREKLSSLPAQVAASDLARRINALTATERRAVAKHVVGITIAELVRSGPFRQEDLLRLQPRVVGSWTGAEYKALSVARRKLRQDG